MPFCPKCGTQVKENQNICLNCGEKVSFNQPESQPVETGSTIGYTVLGFVIPLAGLILYLIWMEEKPKASRSAGLGALLNVITTVLGSILIFIIISILMASGVIEFDNLFDFIKSIL